MTVILVLIFLVWFLAIDNLIIKPMFFKKSLLSFKRNEGTYITTPGFEAFGAFAQDGGELIDAKQSEGKQARS
jgi:hypothetical protein